MPQNFTTFFRTPSESLDMMIASLEKMWSRENSELTAWGQHAPPDASWRCERAKRALDWARGEKRGRFRSVLRTGIVSTAGIWFALFLVPFWESKALPSYHLKEVIRLFLLWLVSSYLAGLFGWFKNWLCFMELSDDIDPAEKDEPPLSAST
ncbi:MAG TPA: hypothetical protein VHK68_09875 [Gemmatimonadales bacterium]|nr:hypothetical protein [Gemmatimonadales bacterium]